MRAQDQSTIHFERNRECQSINPFGAVIRAQASPGCITAPLRMFLAVQSFQIKDGKDGPDEQRHDDPDAVDAE